MLRWLDLHEGEELHLEAGEDIDTVRRDLEKGIYREDRTLEQIKRRQGPVTLRSPSGLEALSNFNTHRLANPDIELRFRYVTTASATVENLCGYCIEACPADAIKGREQLRSCGEIAPSSKQC